jgi:hypothetical protein
MRYAAKSFWRYVLMSDAPDVLTVGHDDWHAKLVGRTPDGRQFFITQPFEPGDKDFIVRYLFDSDGRFLEATIHDLGQRSSGEPPGNALQENADAETLQQQLLAELGNVQFGNIKVRPFSHASNGTEFGLIAQPPEDDEDEWTVVAEPGNYMAFYSPWDDGEYDT